MARVWSVILALVLLGGCARAPSTPAPAAPAPAAPAPAPTATLPADVPGLSADDIATLSSLEQLDEYPLYSLRYAGAYPSPALTAENLRLAGSAESAPGGCESCWGCVLFAALGDPGGRLYGRNFDWHFSPALLLFTAPPDGYASLAMVDIEYLGFAGDRSKNLTDLPLIERQGLLSAPAFPFDGLNEKGLAVGMAAVPPGGMQADPQKKTIGELGVMRAILDRASTVDEAVEILASYNIDMGSVPLHYLVASASGESALVEFYQGEMAVFRNEDPWQHATNFLLAATGGSNQGQCPRYDRISQRLQELEGRLSLQQAVRLLAEVAQAEPGSQSPTQWSVIYGMTQSEVHVVMGRQYTEGIHTLSMRSSDH
jgi:hypothetical protein